MSHPSLLLGADGGGTKTLGILADARGVELSRVQVGASNPNVVGVDGAAATLADLLLSCCKQAGCSPADLAAAVFGLAGGGNAAVQERLTAALRSLLEKQGVQLPAVRIETDARIALEGAFGGGPGIIVIAGTGSAVLGKSPDGSVRLVGGWGRILGDEGSGHFIGLEALKILAQMLDGRMSPGLLRTIIENRFGLGSRERIVSAVYQEGMAVSSLAPAVLAAAEQGDTDAMEIFRRGAGFLSEQVAVLVRAYSSLERIGVVFIGGLIDRENLYSRLLRDAVCASSPAVKVGPPQYPPVNGAVLLAQASLS